MYIIQHLISHDMQGLQHGSATPSADLTNKHKMADTRYEHKMADTRYEHKMADTRQATK
jgi:hypothetical protein